MLCPVFIIFVLIQKSFADDLNAHPCGKSTHTGAVGILQPKDNTIKAGSTCDWGINPQRGEIYLYFDIYELKDKDTFTIKNDSDKGNVLFGPFNGTIKSYSILTGVTSAFVSLTCNSQTDCLFRAHYDSQKCSQDLQENVGAIQSPIFGSGRSNVVVCSWRFNQSVTEYVALQTFSLTSSSVAISGTKNADGTYSKDKSPPDFLGAEFPNINLSLNTSAPNDFIEFIFSPYTDTCSDAITLSTDKQPTFTLNTPQIHEQDYECRWIVTSPEGSTINLQFKSISLTNADKFQINDGAYKLSPEMGIFSQKDSKSLLNKVFTSTKNSMWVAFSSQPLLYGSNFVVELSITKKNETVEKNGDCHKFITELAGIVQETVTDDCELTFMISNTGLLYINFEKLDLKDLEALELVSDLNESKNTFAHFSRHDLPQAFIISTTNNVTLNINVNKATNIKIAYSDQCNFDLEHSGSVVSPSYLPLATNNIFCSYNFKLNTKYQLKFESYNLNRSHIEIEDERCTLKKCFDCDYLPEDMVLPANSTLKLFLSTLEPEEYVAFSYYSINAICNRTVYLNQIDFLYNLHLERDNIFDSSCWISIVGPQDYSIEVLIREINNTKLDFYDASTHLFEVDDQPNNLSTHKTIPASHNPLTVFIAPASNLTVEASFWIKTDNSVCGGKKNHNHTRGRFQPTNNEMLPNSECSWNLAPDGHPQQIYLFINTYLQPNDVLTIYEYNNPANIYFKYKDGITSPFSILTGQIAVSVSVKTLEGAIRPFSVLYDSIVCGQNITEEYGFYVSPVYKPGNDTIICQWTFLEEGDYQMVFNNWNLDSNLSSIYLGDKTYMSNPGDLFFGKNDFLNVTLDLAKPNETISFSFLKSTPECSKQINLNGPHSQPLYFPSLAYKPYACNYILTAPVGAKIGLNFSNFNVDSGTFFVVNDGPSELNTTLMVVTNINQHNMAQRFIRSTHNELRIQMKTSLLLPNSSIIVSAFVDPHGGYLNQPSNFSIYQQSVYLLEVDEESQVRLNILSGFPKDACLEILSDFYTNAPLIRKMCSGNDTSVVSPTNKMAILPFFKSSAPIQANFSAIPKGCFSISTENSASYSLAGSSPVDCSWVITSHDGAVIILQFNLVKTTGKIFTQEEDLISELSANMPLLYIPGGMGVRIEIEPTEAPKTELVLQAHYDITERCSTTFKNFSQISVSSPNFPNAYPLLANCWTNFSVSENLYFSFKLLDLAPGHKLTIYDNGKVWNAFTHGSSIAKDFILSSKASLQFTSGVCKPGNCALKSLESYSGYSLEVTKLSGGSEITQVKGFISTEDQLKAPFAYMWIINIPSKDMLNFSLSWPRGNDTASSFKIYDGASVKVALFSNLTSDNLLSRSPTIIVTYINLNSSNNLPGFKLTFATQKCIVRCLNQFCMHEDWVCNDVNDCGDWTDERSCNASWPTPPADCNPKSWAMGVGIGVPLTFLIGVVLGLVVIPILLSKYREWREDVQYRELTVGGMD